MKSSFGNRLGRSFVFGFIPLGVWYSSNRWVYHNMHLGYRDIFVVGMLGYFCGLGDGQED